MSRSKRKVSFLAARAGMSPILALELLKKAHFSLTQESDVVAPGRRLALAERVLGLAKPVPSPPPPGKRTPPSPTTKVVVPPKRPEPELPPVPVEHRPLRVDGLPLVGRRQPLQYLQTDVVEKIHWLLVEDFQRSRDPISPPGVKEQNLLKSAMTRCQTSLGRDLKYPTLPMAAAALLHSLVHNHPFHNGNKRTALVAMLTFLDTNGSCIRCEEDDLFEFVIALGAHRATIDGTLPPIDADSEVQQAAQWIHKHIYRKRSPSRNLKFHQLRSILQRYDCTFETTSRSSINIIRFPLKTQVWYGGDGREVDIGTIQKIRRDLQLDEEHGLDAAFFYSADARLPEFITRYRKTLGKLAKH